MGRPRTPADRDPAPSIALNLPTPQECEALIEPFGFSPRQARIVCPILQGKGDKQIADALGLTVSTVRTYLGRIFLRLGVADRMEMVLAVFIAHVRANR